MIRSDAPLLREAHVSALRALAQGEIGFLGSAVGLKGGRFLTRSSGNSLEFREHRNYFPGDDPRFIDWKAAARTGSHFIRVHQEEILPLVDIFVDLSRSMFVTDAKARRLWELVYLLFEGCRRENAAYRIWACSAKPRELPPSELETYRVSLTDGDQPLTDTLRAIPLRQGSLKIVISDLLFPGEPRTVLHLLGQRTVILVPSCSEEREPRWSGNTTFIDCETGAARVQNVTQELLQRYVETYRRHFRMWTDETARLRARLFPICAELPLAAVVGSLGSDSQMLPSSGAR